MHALKQLSLDVMRGDERVSVGTTAQDAADGSGAAMEINEGTPGPRTGKPMRRGEDVEEENQSLQTTQEEEARDIEQDVPDIANELVERDGGEQNSEPPIFEE